MSCEGNDIFIQENCIPGSYAWQYALSPFFKKGGISKRENKVKGI